ncbi:MAG: GTP-binding protein [Lachnospira sp.]|nr:GTP-binding protein [Lachnospira sp.]
MTKVDIISGFLGAGKTTLISKLLKEALAGEQVVLIENEFGEIGIDGGFLKDSGVEIREMNSGCICCSLVGDFGTSLKEVVDKYHPDRIIIEPSGVGKLSDVIKAVKDLHIENEIQLNSASTVADASKCKVYMKNFGEFFNNQIEHAGTIILSRTQNISEEKLNKAIELIRQLNPNAHVITTPWDDIEGAQILGAMENVTNLELEMLAEAAEKAHAEHEHEHHHHDGEECCCGHDHDEDHDHEEHEHHHHHDGEECCCGHDHDHEHDHEEHEHHHDGEACSCGHDHDHEHDHEEHEHHHHDGETCSCGHDHHHDHEGHHHADDVFTSWGTETPNKYEKAELDDILDTLANSDEYGKILRAKGMLPTAEGTWMYFDLVPGEYEIREGKADFTGRICVIGAELKEAAIKELFRA